MLAVTIATPPYLALAHEQADYFRRSSGLDTLIVTREAEGYHHKLDLPRLFKGQKIIFFDSDYRLLRGAELLPMIARSRGYDFIAAPDPGVHDPLQFPAPDSEAFGIDKGLYFNSGFFVADFNNAKVVDGFNRARQLWAENEHGVWKQIADPGEQSYLNAGIQRAGCKIKLLHPRWNFFFHAWRWGTLPEVPRNIVGVHAAGTHVSEKKAILDAETRIYGMEQGGHVLPGVARWYKQFKE